MRSNCLASSETIELVKREKPLHPYFGIPRTYKVHCIWHQRRSIHSIFFGNYFSCSCNPLIIFIFYLYVSFSIGLLFNYLSVESLRILIQNSVHDFVSLLDMCLSIITSLTTTIRTFNLIIRLPHREPEAKQSQYSFKHFVFLQLQVFC